MGRELRGTTVRPPMLPTMPGLISASPKAREWETRWVKHQNDGAPRPLAVVWLLWFQTWMTDAEDLTIWVPRGPSGNLYVAFS